MAAPTALPPDSTIQRILDDRVAHRQTVGIVVATLDATGLARIYHAGSSGQPDVALSGDTVFEIGSNTKLITGALLADMVMKGEVTLDDPVATYLPASIDVPERSGKQITLIDLATHTSGLPVVPPNIQPSDLANPYADYSVDMLYRSFDTFELPRDIGTEYEYSNFGFGLLGHALALRAGTTWERAVSERILLPLNMTSTVATVTPSELRRLAVGHDDAGRPVSNWDIPALPAMGALRSTANDLLKFLAANMDSTSIPLGKTLALTRISRRKAWDSATMMGLGWQIGHPDYKTIIRHSGGTGGYASFIGFDRARRVGVIVLANSSTQVWDLGFHLLDQRFTLDPTG